MDDRSFVEAHTLLSPSGASQDRDAPEVLTQALEAHHPHIALACSFSAEDVVVLDMMKLLRADARVFALDTGRLPPQTYELADQIRIRLNVEIEWFFPQTEALQTMVRDHGVLSFRRSVKDRRSCCHTRKVEPLGRALAGLEAWVTGMRRDQATTRTQIAQVETDESHGGIRKINPIAGWTTSEVWRYVAARNLPYHALYERGYTQIGCQPCTTPVHPGEDPRAGRWRWEAAEHKECGLHSHHKGSGI